MAEYIERGEAIRILSNPITMSMCVKLDECKYKRQQRETDLELIKSLPTADVLPVVRCKDCKHFHLDYFGEVNGVNIIVAHEICDLWAGGCRTTQDTFCSNGARKDGENNVQTIQDILIQNKIQRFYDAAKYLSEDIQHVGYSKEACGYEK